MKAVMNHKSEIDVLLTRTLVWFIFMFLLYLACIAYVIISFLHNRKLTFMDIMVLCIGHHLHHKHVKPFFKQRIIRR
jgi:hypothetical protein